MIKFSRVSKLNGKDAIKYRSKLESPLFYLLNMSNQQTGEHCLIVEGSYLDESDAEHALRDPFIEEWVEQTGKFRIHNFDDIEVAGGFSLGDLVITMIDDEVFEITSSNSSRLLNAHKANLIAEALKRQGMFDEIKVQPLETTS